MAFEGLIGQVFTLAQDTFEDILRDTTNHYLDIGDFDDGVAYEAGEIKRFYADGMGDLLDQISQLEEAGYIVRILGCILVGGLICVTIKVVGRKNNESAQSA